MNTRISQDDDRQLNQLAQFTGGHHYVIESPGPGDSAPYVADPSIRLGRWAANNRMNGIALQNQLQNRTHDHRLSSAGAPPISSAAALSQQHPLVLANMNRADLAGPFDTINLRLTDPAFQYRQMQTGHYFTQQPLVESRPVLATPRLAAAPVRMRGDTFVR